MDDDVNKNDEEEKEGRANKKGKEPNWAAKALHMLFRYYMLFL